MESTSYGLLLPHFGPHATRDNLLRLCRTAEQHSFDSVWVRDHIVFRPHEHEAGRIDRTHIDPLVTLAFVAGATERLTLGTAAIIPHRHPIHLALLLASLQHVAGSGRVLAGVGIGNFDHEFDAVGLGGIKRLELLTENIEILRQLWTGEETTHEGRHYQFHSVDIRPTPTSGALPIWYCGNSPAAVRYAAAHCDGWLPGRMPLSTLEKRLDLMQQVVADQGRIMPSVGNIPIVSPGRSIKEAARRINLDGLLAEYGTHSRSEPPSAGGSLEELRGGVIAGPAHVIVEDTMRLHEVGVRHVVYDLRFRFEDWKYCVDLLGTEVLPALRESVA